MKHIVKIIIVCAVFFYAGCSIQEPIKQSTAYLISIKTPQMAFSDTGFINEADTYTNLQIFNAGTLVLKIEIVDDTICLDGTCLAKEDFNKRFFGATYYADLMENIVHQKPLFEGRDYLKTTDGFSQQIRLPYASIDYRVEKGSVYFKEREHGVMIRLRPLP